jgi:hypothetical protein
MKSQDGLTRQLRKLSDYLIREKAKAASFRTRDALTSGRIPLVKASSLGSLAV